MTHLAPGPWLSIRSRLAHLDADLRARGWQVRHQSAGQVHVTAPDGQAFTCADLRAAYETAREYAGTLTWNEASA